MDQHEISSSPVLDFVTDRYKMAFEHYTKWCNDNDTKDYGSENVLLSYFQQLSNDRKPTTLWAYYSMVKKELLLQKNVDIKEYKKLLEFLRKRSEGYKAKKSKVLTEEHIKTFLQNADDEKFLSSKVILIFGLAGGCRRPELAYLLRKSVIDETLCFRVTVNDLKTKLPREFFITSGNIEGVNLVDIVRQYINLRPKNCGHDRFFVQNKSGKCTKQPIGVNTVGTVPTIIAKFLKLPNPKQYTSHCLRRSSMSLISDPVADVLNLRREVQW